MPLAPGSKPGYVRKQKVVDPAYQFRYALTLIVLATTEGVLLAGVLLIAIFSVIEISPEDHIRLFYYIVAVAGGMIVLINAINVVAGILLSHRISGPVYRFMQVAKNLAAGDLSQVVRLREKDELQELKDRLNEALDGLRGLAREQNAQVERVAAGARELQALAARPGGADTQAWNHLLDDVDKLKGRFKI